MNIHTKQIAALRLSIDVLERERRTRYAAGNAAYLQGIRRNVIDCDGITGIGFEWAEEDHKSYEQYSGAIQELEDLIEIMEDPGVSVDAPEPVFEESYAALPLFAEV